MCMTPWTVRLAISVAHSSPSRYSEEKGSASKSGPDGASRRSTGNRSRSVGTLEPRPASGPSQLSSSPTFHRIAQSVRAARDEPCDGSPEAISCTRRGKSSGPPCVGSAHTSSSRKSRVSSWIRQAREVCALFGSLIRGPPGIRWLRLPAPFGWARCGPLLTLSHRPRPRRSAGKGQCSARRLDAAGACDLRQQAGRRHHVAGEEDAGAAVYGGPVTPRRTREVERAGAAVHDQAAAPGDALAPAVQGDVEQALEARGGGVFGLAGTDRQLRLDQLLAGGRQRRIG